MHVLFHAAQEFFSRVNFFFIQIIRLINPFFFNYSCLHFIIILLAAVFLGKSTSRSEQARVGFISYCDVYCVFYTKKEHIFLTCLKNRFLSKKKKIAV